MILIAIIALAAGALIVAMLAIAFPEDDPDPKGAPTAQPQTPVHRRPILMLRGGSRPVTQAWQSAVRGVQDNVRRFLVLLESDRRNVRQFRREHPETGVLMLTFFISVVVTALIIRH